MTTRRSFLLALNARNDQPPAVIAVMPEPGTIGDDGRACRYAPLALIAAFRAGGRDIPIDLEHATELKGPHAEPAPAVGWVTELFEDQNGLAARVAWTDQGAKLVASRAYRFVSPAYTYDRSTGEALALSSIALTNKPNFPLAALNRQGEPSPNKERRSMKRIADKLGLNPEASEDAILAELDKRDKAAATALHRADNPDLGKFVPRADYDKALHRAETAEGQIADAQAAEVEALVDQGIKDGKIAPASKDFYLSAAKQEGGREQLETLLAGSGALLPTDPGKALHRQQPNTKAGPSVEEKAIFANLGLDEADLTPDEAAA